MLACEATVETIAAVSIQRTIERATGELCPCKSGQPCPIRFELGNNAPRDDVLATVSEIHVA